MKCVELPALFGGSKVQVSCESAAKLYVKKNNFKLSLNGAASASASVSIVV